MKESDDESLNGVVLVEVNRIFDASTMKFLTKVCCGAYSLCLLPISFWDWLWAQIPGTGKMILSLNSINLDDVKNKCNLVDPASSHMLVSKIKPCKSEFKIFWTKLRMAHYNSDNLCENKITRITVVILELKREPFRRSYALDSNQVACYICWSTMLWLIACREFAWVSDLSAFDGMVLAYHGYDG